MSPVLSIRDLRVEFDTPAGVVQAVRGVSLDVEPGELVGIVGESGSGKSVSFLSIMGLLPGTARVTGSATVAGTELIGVPARQVRAQRGKKIAMIFQDPLSALNPVHRIGTQIVEMIRAHQDISQEAAHARAVELLDLVGLPQPDVRATQYPHEFSGGMRQRVMIAMAIANDPEVLIADEPTTALDVTVQAQILEVIENVRRQLHTAVVFITRWRIPPENSCGYCVARTSG
ncbi:MAG: ABC transporter ATP-binding protein, partial [Acidimicrobiales bacterium]